MTTMNSPLTNPTASTFRVGARLAVLVAVCAALATGFVAGLTTPTQDPASQVARTPAACVAPTC